MENTRFSSKFQNLQKGKKSSKFVDISGKQHRSYFNLTKFFDPKLVGTPCTLYIVVIFYNCWGLRRKINAICDMSQDIYKITVFSFLQVCLTAISIDQVIKVGYSVPCLKAAISTMAMLNSMLIETKNSFSRAINSPSNVLKSVRKA